MTITFPDHVPAELGVVQVTFAGEANPVISAIAENLRGVDLDEIFAGLNGMLDLLFPPNYLVQLVERWERCQLRSMSVGDLVSLWNHDETECLAVYSCSHVGWRSILVESIRPGWAA